MRRRRDVLPDDSRDVQDAVATTGDHGAALLALYDAALPRVYGYLLRRCGRTVLAEELCAQTFLAAVGAVRRNESPTLSVPWLIGVARHKLVDHWRAQAREERGLALVGGEKESEVEDPWDAHLDTLRAQDTLDKLTPHHRAALTLRYLDDLPVREVASHLDRSVHATEGLLVRARRAFRRAYEAEEADDD